MLDEPTSGLDPLVQQEFYAILREAKAEGRTVFMSSHILGEVERTCRPGGDHPRGPADQGGPRRGAARHGAPPGGAALHRSGARRRVRAIDGVSDVVTDDHVLRMRVAGDITPVVRPRPDTSWPTSSAASRPWRRPSWPSTARTAGTDAGRAADARHDRHHRSLSRPSPLSRLFGLGSVFGKTLRDSRRATLLVGFAIGALLVVVAAGIISQFDTPEARDEIGNIVNAVPPIMQGLAGKPVNVETLGGYHPVQVRRLPAAGHRPMVDPGAVRHPGR